MKSSRVESDRRRTGRSLKPTPRDESPPKSRSRVSPSRSPARGRPTTRRSPARKPSPARRSPARRTSPVRKSPARKSPARKSPARRSPARSARDAEEPTKSPSRRPAIKTESAASDVSKIELTKLPSSRRVTEYSAQQFSISLKSDVLNGIDSVGSSITNLRERKTRPLDEAPVARRSSRLRDVSETYEKLLNLAQSTKLPRGDSFYENLSDGDNLSEDDTLFKKDKSLTRKLATPLRELSLPRSVGLEFGGWMGAALQLLLMPLIIVSINILCGPSQCSFSFPDLRPYAKLQTWLNPRAAAVYLSYVLLQATVSIVPYFGRKVPLPSGRGNLRTNGIFSVFVTLSIMGTLEFFKIPIFRMIYEDYTALMLVATVFGLSLSILLFVLSRKVPTEDRNNFGNTGNAFYDFWMGREVNPVLFGKLHFKLLFLRSALILAVLMNCVALYRGTSILNFPTINNKTILEAETYKQIVGSVTLKPTLVAFAAMQICYFMHAICSESKLISTFEFQYEGTGGMLALGYSLYPFTTVSITRYILLHSVELSNVIIAATLIIYFIGFYIYHASNSQKSAFRKNPLDPKLAYLESLPTFHGKRLLISGWWGFVRHPNYLGDIILHMAWAVAVLSAPPVLFIALTVFFLAHRASRDGQRCRKRYGTAWDRYCRRVPYNIIPKVY